MTGFPAFALRGLIRGLLTRDPKKRLGAGHEGRVLDRRVHRRCQTLIVGLWHLLTAVRIYKTQGTSVLQALVSTA